MHVQSSQNYWKKRRGGIFSSCAGSMHPEDSDDEEASATDRAVVRARFDGVYANSTSSVASSPSLLTRDRRSGPRSKGFSIWRNLKKFNFRRVLHASDQRVQSGLSQDDIRLRRASFTELSVNGDRSCRISDTGSHPNLVIDVGESVKRIHRADIHSESNSSLSVSKVGALLVRKKKRRHEGSPGQSGHRHNWSTNTGSILVKNSSGARRSSVNRVEFASSDRIIPLIVQDCASSVTPSSSCQTLPCRDRLSAESGVISSMTSPVRSLFSRAHRRAERQSTFESTSSVTTDDLFRQDTLSGGSVDHDPPVPVPIAAYLLHVHLKEGHDLVIRDASGSSDPYVKFKFRNKLIYKSNTIFKDLNPHWDEQFYELIDDPSLLLHVDVFDYDRFASDDFMGSAILDLSKLEAKRPTDLKVMLGEENNSNYMGYLLMQVCLSPLTRDEQDQFLRKKTRVSQEGSTGSNSGSGSLRRGQKGTQVWNSMVNIVLVEAKNLLPTDVHTSVPLPDPYVKFKLGVEKYKSKPASKTLEPKWLEQFDLHIFDDQSQQLELMVFDKRKDIFMGRCKIDLSAVETEVTQQKWYELEDGAGQVLLLLTISGTVGLETVADLGESPLTNMKALAEKYALVKTFDNMRDIGHLVVKVYRAQGLAAADIGGKSDPFCVVELVNARLQTHTEYKTLNPEWNKLFTFNVKDIHSVLELTVYDEDPNKKVEFLGKVAIPLLKIRTGEKRWYALKDRKLQSRAKGQILLEMEVVWNPIRASVRTFNPKEEKYMAHEIRFKRQTFLRNVMRVKNFAVAAMEAGAFVQSCFSWDSPPRSAVAFTLYMAIVCFFELYMLPLALLLLFVKSYVCKVIAEGIKHSRDETAEYFGSEDDDEDEDKDEKKSIKERFHAIQDTLAMVQNALDYIASTMERAKNTFNFTQPYLSWLAIVVLCVGTVVLYSIPIRWLAMAWGINKFTKKLRCPNDIPNNELLDFLSRVPSDDEIRMYGEYRPDPVDGTPGAAGGQPARAKKQRNP